MPTPTPFHSFRVLFALLALTVLTGGRPAPHSGAGGGRAGVHENFEAFARDVAAPPEDILLGLLRLPEATELVQRSGLRRVPLEFQEVDGRFVTEIEHPPLSGRVTLALLGRDVRAWSLEAHGEAGWRPLVDAVVEVGGTRSLQVVTDDVLADRFDWIDDGAGGALVLRISAPSSTWREPFPGELWIADEHGPVLESRLSTLELLADRPIAIEARLAAASGARIVRAELFIEGEIGRFARRVPVQRRSAAGWLEASLPRGLSGAIDARLVVVAEGPSGTSIRTAQYHFTIHEPALALDGSVEARPLDEQRLELQIAATPLAAVEKVHVSAEVWGRTPDGVDVPVAWLSRMQRPDAERGLRLVLDARWLDRAGVGAPLELRNLRVQHPDTHVPFARAERTPIRITGWPAWIGRAPGPVTLDMLTGRSDEETALRSGPRGGTSFDAGVVKARTHLMLVHGYCAGGSPFPDAHFSGLRLAFSDPNQNRSHDEFALLIRDFGETVDAFSVVAHSQGGAAALHLYTYYESNLDRARGGRLIQSLGTPYQGTALAAFGGLGACGVNDDMTESGAALWLAGIPSWARAKVHYWTTAGTGGQACSFVANFVLDEPNDGVVEVARGALPGGVPRAHLPGWCHTTGMTFPAHYIDAARNAERDSAAAR